jgi:anti-anti-sigma factor
MESEKTCSMKITLESFKSWQIIPLKGKFIVRNIPLIRKHFERAKKVPFPHIALDMAEISQIDSSAFTILVNYQRNIIQHDGLLVLFGIKSDIAEIFSIVGVDKLFRICTNRAEFEEQYSDSET